MRMPWHNACQLLVLLILSRNQKILSESNHLAYVAAVARFPQDASPILIND